MQFPERPVGAGGGARRPAGEALANRSPARGARMRRTAKVAKVACTLWMFVGLPVLVLTMVTGPITGLWFAVFLLALVVTLAATAGARAADRLDQQAQRHLVRSSSEATLDDPRPPLLYLRSFADEPATRRIRLGRHWDRAFAEEEFLVGALREVGPVVAIGRPDDELPPIGVHRKYVGDAEWTSRVVELMEHAAGVLVRIGPGEGLAWEIEQVVARVPRERLVFLVPHDRDAYERLRRRLERVIPATLPPFPELRWEDHVPEAALPVVRLLTLPPGTAEAINRRVPGFRLATVRSQFFPDGLELLGCLRFEGDWSARLEVLRFGGNTPSRTAVERELARCLEPFTAAVSRQRRG